MNTFICFIFQSCRKIWTSACHSIFIDLLSLSLSVSHTHRVTLALDYAITLNHLPVLLSTEKLTDGRGSPPAWTQMCLSFHRTWFVERRRYRWKDSCTPPCLCSEFSEWTFSSTPAHTAVCMCVNALITSPRPCPTSTPSLHFSFLWSPLPVWVPGPPVYNLPACHASN